MTFVQHDAGFCLLQSGSGNSHCGVYCMALGINYVMKTLGNMSSILAPLHAQRDTRPIGLELRKMVAWDCTRVPPLLDACLAMCPTFSHDIQHSRPSTLDLNLNPWWRITPHHDIAIALSTQPELQSGGIFSLFGR